MGLDNVDLKITEHVMFFIAVSCLSCVKIIIGWKWLALLIYTIRNLWLILKRFFTFTINFDYTQKSSKFNYILANVNASYLDFSIYRGAQPCSQVQSRVFSPRWKIQAQHEDQNYPMEISLFGFRHGCYHPHCWTENVMMAT